MSPLSAIRAYSPAVELQRSAMQPSMGKVIDADLQSLGRTSDIQSSKGTTSVDGSFGNVLGRFVNDVNQKQIAAKETVSDLLGGEKVSLHQAMLSMEEASISFQLMVEVRNKLLESYQELMRMQV